MTAYQSYDEAPRGSYAAYKPNIGTRAPLTLNLLRDRFGDLSPAKDTSSRSSSQPEALPPAFRPGGIADESFDSAAQLPYKTQETRYQGR